MIRFESVTKSYKGGVTAVKDLTLEIGKGEFVFLVGPSGSGKSTCFRLLMKEEVADTGRIWVGDRELSSLSSWKVPYLRRNMGCVFQDFKLLPYKTVYENVAFALEVIGKPRSVVKQQVPQILDLVGLRRLWRAIFGRAGKLGAVAQAKLEGTDRARNVFDALFIQIVEGDRQFMTNVVSYPARHADATRLGEGFETGSNIDAIAEDVPILHHHIADIKADTELHVALFRRSVVGFGK